MSKDRRELEHSDEVVGVPARLLAYQRKTWVRVVVAICVLAAIAIASVTWTFNHALQEALGANRRTQAALDRANAVIATLSADNGCRSKAAAAESAAGWTLVGGFILNREDPRLPALVTALNKATEAREKTVDGCPDPPPTSNP